MDKKIIRRRRFFICLPTKALRFTRSAFVVLCYNHFVNNHTNYKHLYRSRDNRIIAGVFGGVGEYFAVDPVILRIIFILVLIVTAIVPCALAYIISMFVIPLEGEHTAKVVHEE